MRGFLLDTNIPSEMPRPRPDASVAAWVKLQANETLFVSVVTMGESAGHTMSPTCEESPNDPRSGYGSADSLAVCVGLGSFLPASSNCCAVHHCGDHRYFRNRLWLKGHGNPSRSQLPFLG